MTNEWNTQVLLNSKRENEEQESKFLDLVSSIKDKCTYDVLKVLMKTFSNKPDYGTQERVISIMQSGNDKEVSLVILEELPRLYNEANEWAEVLIGGELEHKFNTFSSVIPQVSSDVKSCLKLLLKDEDFVDFYPQAKKLQI